MFKFKIQNLILNVSLFLFSIASLFGQNQSTNGTAVISNFNNCSVSSGGGLYVGTTVNGVFQIINVNVTTLGTYNISATANGVTFSASSTFTSLGNQNVILTAAGTPTNSGINTFVLNTTPNCSFTRTVYASQTPPPAPTPLINVVPQNTTNNTTAHLLNNVLINSICTQTSNINSESSPIAANTGIGYFTYSDNLPTPNFPYSAGVIMMTGSAIDAMQKSSVASSNSPGWTISNEIGNPDLLPYMQSIGTNVSAYRDQSVIVFDFYAITSDFGFDFIFASDEYGTFQCAWSDAFAFFLTNLTTNTFTNLAVVPNTSPASPIAVTSIRNQMYNNGCGSVNENYFGKYYHPQTTAPYPAGEHPNLSPAVFNGYTVPMRASSTLIPGNMYRLKMVVGNRNDNAYNSAVFLKAGSFNVGAPNVTHQIPNTPTITSEDLTAANGTSLCAEECRVLNTSLPTSVYQISWTKDGVVIPGETGPSLTVCGAGTYCFSAFVPAINCTVSDCIIVEALSSTNFNAGTPQNLRACANTETAPYTFDLCSNTTAIMTGSVDVDDPSNIVYYASMANLEAQTNPLPCLYQTSVNQTIYARVQSFSTACYLVRQFDLIIDSFTINTIPTSISSYTLPINLTQNNAAILNGLIPADYSITFYETQANADAGTNAIVDPTIYSGSATTIYVRVTPLNNMDCYSTTQINLVFLTPPTATIQSSQTICFDGSATINITGTPNATVVYNDGTSNTTIIIPASGTYTFTHSGALGTKTYTLVSVYDGAITVNLTGNITITVTPQITANITVQTPICYNSPSQICVTGSPNATINITDNNSNSYSVTLDASGNGCIATPNLTANTTYTLVNGSISSPIACSNALSGSATVSVRPLITASVSATSPICSGQTSTVTISGTPDATIVVSNGSTSQNVVLNTSGVGSFITPNLTADTTYSLVSGSITSPISCSNAVSGSFIVDVVDAPAPGTPTTIQVCDVNNDGYATFNMTPAIAQAQAGNTNWVVSFHLTSSDAQFGSNPILNYTNYTNTTVANNSQIIYIRVIDPANPNCYGLTSVLLQAIPTPELNNNISAYELCETTKPGDGFEIFNLTTKSTEILNGATGITLSYYTSQADAVSGNNAITNSTSFTNTVNPQTIWVRGSFVSGCYDITSFVLNVNPLPTLTALNPMFGCSNGSSATPLVSSFDLNTNNSLVTGGVSGMSVTYHLTQADADNEVDALSSPYNNITNPQTLYVRVENNNTGCYDTTTLVLNVTQGPVANTPAPLEVCDPNSDGKAFFDLTQALNDISGGSPQPGVTYTFHETQTDAQFGSNPISNTTSYANIVDYNQIIWVRAAYTTGCYNIVQLQLIVHPTPQATTPNDLHACDGTDNNGIAQFDLTQTITEVLTGLTPATNYSIRFYATEIAAQAGGSTGEITNVTNYSGYNNQEVFIRVENINTGCFDVVSVILQVHSLPIMPAPESIVYTLCDVNNTGDEKEVFNLNSQIPLIIGTQTNMNVTFHLTLADAQNNTGALPSNYTNLSNPQSLFVRVENSVTGCYNWVIMDLRVAPLPTIVTPDDIEMCDYDGNPDLSTPVDLTALIPDILNGETGVTITFHVSQTDADLSVNAISNPASYSINDITGVQTIYIRATNTTTGCYSTSMFIITVYNPPVMPTLPNLTLCDVTPNIYDGKTYFDLTVQNPLILATNAGHQIRYYHSQADAEAGLSAIVNPTNYFGTNAEVIWVRVLNTATECFDIGSFTLHINTPIDVRGQNNLLSLCDNNLPNDNFTTFDLTVMNAQILALATTVQNPANVTYYPSYNGMINGTQTAIANPSAYINQVATVQTLGVMVTSAQGCISYTTLTIRVLPIPNVKTDPPALVAKCDYTTPGDMNEYFNLTTNIGYILNGNTNYVVSYHASQSDAELDINPITTPNNYYGGGSAWIRVENNWVGSNGANCAVIIEQLIPVNPLPVVINDTYTLCETNNSTEISTFDLTTQITDILGASQSPTDYTVSFYLTQADASAGTSAIANETAFQNTTNPQIIYVRVVNNNTGCANTGTLTLSVSPSPSIGALTNVSTCDYDGINDGITTVNLTPYINQALGTQSPTLFSVSFYESQAQAQAGTNAITNLTTYQNNNPINDIVWVRVTNNSSGCYVISSFTISVEILAEPIITNNTNGIACVAYPTNTVTNGLVLNSGITNPNYTFTWYLNNAIITGASSSTYTVTTMLNATDKYRVVATSTSALGCISNPSAEITITRSSGATAVGNGYVISNYFADNQTITVNVTGYSINNYLYQLDNGPKQSSNVFTNVSAGVHTVTVYDPTSNDVCGILILTGINTVNYPHYFTPNGDGYNDNWQIIGLENQPQAKVMIFDRYGKLIKQINTTSAGWDGTFNGNQLPATDYWFIVEYIENNQQKTFKAHFSLKR